jgi:ribonuclease HII
MTKEAEAELLELGIKDSKEMSSTQRETFYHKIMNVATECKVVFVPASEIDMRRKKESLNDIQVSAAVELMKAIDPSSLETIYFDAFDSNEAKHNHRFQALFENSTIVTKHQADSIYPVVSAASVIAKVERDYAVKQIELEYDISVGSGYPADPVTKQYLSHCDPKSFPGFIRHSWKTIVNLQ